MAQFCEWEWKSAEEGTVVTGCTMHGVSSPLWEFVIESVYDAHPLLKTTLTGLRRTYLRFLVFRPKLTKTKRFPPFLDHMNGKFFLGGSRFWSGKIDPKLAEGGSWPHNHGQELYQKLMIIFAQKTALFWHNFTKYDIFVPRCQIVLAHVSNIDKKKRQYLAHFD